MVEKSCGNVETSRAVCHGSRVVVKSPQIVSTRYTKDFGAGFCCTERALKTLSFLKAEEIVDN